MHPKFYTKPLSTRQIKMLLSFALGIANARS